MEYRFHMKTQLVLLAAILGCTPAATSGTVKSPTAAAEECVSADGREWWDCCRRSGAKHPSCADRQLSSEISFSCPVADQACMRPPVGGWDCKRTGDGYETSIDVDAAGVATGVYDRGNNWNRWCLGCDGTFSGIGAYNGVNYAHTGTYVVAPDQRTVSLTVVWCTGRTFSECAAHPEGGASSICRRQ